MQENAVELLDEAIALAKLELQELAQNTEDSLVIADEYASQRYDIVNRAWEAQKNSASSPLFKEKIQALHALQKELLLVAEQIRESIARAIKKSAHSSKALKGYKNSVSLEPIHILKEAKG